MANVCKLQQSNHQKHSFEKQKQFDLQDVDEKECNHNNISMMFTVFVEYITKNFGIIHRFRKFKCIAFIAEKGKKDSCRVFEYD